MRSNHRAITGFYAGGSKDGNYCVWLRASGGACLCGCRERASSSAVEGRPGRGFYRSPRPEAKESALCSDWHLHRVRRSARHGSDTAVGRSSCRGCRLGRRSNQPQRLSHFGIQPRHHILIVFEELAGNFAALLDLLAFIAEPRTRLLQDVIVDRQIEQIAFARNAFPVKDIELGLTERRCNLILNDLYL